jgi:hypothetical protein
MLRQWLKQEFGGKESHYEVRASLLAAGDWVDPIWRYIESGALAYATARDIFRHARLGHNDETRTRRLRRSLKSRIAAAHVEDSNGFSGAMRRYLHGVRTQTKAMLGSAIAGLPPDDAKRIEEDFLETLQLVCNDLRDSIRKVRKPNLKPAERVGRVRFDRACEVLSVTFRYGHPIDMAQVKQRKWQRAKELHPDRNRGSREHEQELQAVLDAFDILEQYSKEHSEDTHA